MLALAVSAVPVGSAARAPADGIAPRGLALVMVDRAGCSFCDAWRREILPGYGAHAIGRALPLAVVPIDGPWPDGLGLDRAPQITPSFLILRDRVEIARLEGYPGARHFWAALDDLILAARPRGTG